MRADPVLFERFRDASEGMIPHDLRAWALAVIGELIGARGQLSFGAGRRRRRRRSQTDPLSGGWEIHSRGLTAVASPEAGGLAVVVEQDDCLGMKLKRATPRRRCCECRSWYAPKPSTSKTQRTCSKACRLRRRGEREKARRAADLGAARKLERVRQRRHRERRKQTPGPQMSRAGLSVEARETIERIVEELGQLQRLSRAGLGRRLRGFLQGEAARAGLEVET
jgi:hypothetical protein